MSSVNLEVLVSSPLCGSLDWEGGSWDGYSGKVLTASAPYALDCYRNGTLPSRCQIYSRPNIPFSALNNTCPFNSTMCASQAIAMDSGLLDLNDAFGMNLEMADRVQFRRKVTCAILSLEGHTRVDKPTQNESYRTGRPPLPNEELLMYLYDKDNGSTEQMGVFGQSLIRTNTTERFGHKYVHLRRVVWPLTFTHSKVTVYAAEPGWSVQLMPELQRNDADVTLKLVARNAVRYLNPVNDPMFSAHRGRTTQNTNGENKTTYWADFPGSVVGCARQVT